MHLKRFLRPTVREALAAARESLGPQALVLSTELIQAPGWRGWAGQRVVSLTAATDRAVSEDRPVVLAPRQESARQASRAGVIAKLIAAGVDAALAEAA